MTDPLEQTVTVTTLGGSYKVRIGEGLLDRTGELVRSLTGISKRCAILTDSNVAPLYAGRVENSLIESGFAAEILQVDSGEKSKSMEEAGRCCDALVAAGLDRKSFLVVLGGGVPGDLGGFVAGIYHRGIPFIQIPTTVVSQVDSSVGGKTGVNMSGGKNLVGVFHQPSLVIADPLTLTTLPDREFREGLAEVVKHAVIRDASMLADILPNRRNGLVSLLARNVAIKAAIVAADERESSGLRALLNFGHTVGHAIENAAGYGEFFHGEAISLGMIVALRLSRKFAGLSQEAESVVAKKLVELALPVDLKLAPPTERILDAMRSDKKFESGAVRFVLCPKLGEAIVSDQVGTEDICATLEELRRKG